MRYLLMNLMSVRYLPKVTALALCLLFSLPAAHANDTADTGGDQAQSSPDAGGETTCGEGGGCREAAVDVGSSEQGVLPDSSLGNPINLMSGNKYQRETDFQIPGAMLSLNRMYNSGNSNSNQALGQGWQHSYTVNLFNAGQDRREIVQSDGARILFAADGVNDDGDLMFRAQQSHHGYLRYSNQRYYWHLSDGRIMTFNRSYLTQIDWPDQRKLDLYYRSKRLHSVTDETGRSLVFHYSGDVQGSRLRSYDQTRFSDVPGYLTRVTLPDGSDIGYDYDSNLNLTRVRFADGTSREYHYENEFWPNHLTGLTDRNGVRYASWSYDDQGRAISSEHAGGVEKVTLQFPDPITVAQGNVVETVVTNSLGAQSVYTWQKRPGLSREVLLSSYGPGCVTCPPTGIAYEYDQQGRLLNATKTGLGNAVGSDGLSYRYDEQGRLSEVRRIDALGNDELVERREFADAHSQLPVRTYYPSVNPNGERLVEIERDPRGQPLRVIEQGWKPSSVQSAEAIAFTPIERITTLTYQENQLATVDGPRTDVDDITRFQYDSLGRVLRIELPSNEVVTIHNYDGQGRAVDFQRANHPRVTLQYDDNGNVSRVTRLGQSVQYTYNAEGSLVSVTNPNGKTTQLSYDEARRLTRVSDDLERTVSLTFNNEGQLKQRTYQGINGELIRSLNYVFDIDGRIQSVGEEKQDNTTGNLLSKRVDLYHDASGQLTAASDSQTGATRNFVFNHLGQLLQSLDANGLPVSHEYDVHNRLTAQTDERQNTTRYHRDDFGQVHFLVSPDTGVTQYDYDAAGNRTQKRDALGEITRYRWDAANRLVEQQDRDGTATYVYDRTNGQLIEASNAHSIETYTYTRLAQLKTHTRELDGNRFTTEYFYSSNGKLSKKILPDGQALRFHYYEDGPNKDTLRAITKEALFGLSQSTLLGEIDLDWRDGQTSYLSHNGRRSEIHYHADGTVDSMSVTNTLTLEYEYDEYGKIVGIRQDGNDQRFGYRAGQLTEANTISGDYRYQYDVTGNRTSISAQASSDDHASTLAYPGFAAGNQLQSWTDQQTGEEISYRYNDAGSPVAIGNLSYTYNTNQRPIEVRRDGELIAEYRYNNFGERIKKVSYSQNQKKVTYYLYDNRTLVAEIDGDTLEHRQTVYLKHVPVVHLIGEDVYAVHTDHLGTPKLLTNNDGQVAWEATHTPLGEAIISQQDIEFNLRFPGQYADAETGTHYNYQRDYDPRTGRYLTSDPVGLEGGDNTYAYASNDVLGAIDVLGLSSEWIALAGGGPLAGDAVNSNEVEPFSLRSANSAVINPSVRTPDVTDLDVTDTDNLITDFHTLGSPCDSEMGMENFAEQIERIVGEPYDSFLNAGNFFVGNEIDWLLEITNRESYEIHDVEYASVQLEIFAESGDASILLIPECTDDDEVGEIVRAALGTLVRQSEIDAIISSMAVAADGCNEASIIDVTDLHAEVLIRFQVSLASDPRVVEAEKSLILAQAALEDFLALNPDHNCEYDGGGTGFNFDGVGLCIELFNLMNAIEAASENLANVLSDVYKEQVDNKLLPPYDTEAAKAAARERIMLGILGVFIPLTAEDAAVEAALLATTAGFGKVARVFTNAVEFFKDLSKTERASRIGEALASGGDVAKARADAIKLAEYSRYTELQGLDYADIVRIEGKIGADKLGKLETDLANTPGLANALADNPRLAGAWNAIDDIGVCSFDGSTTVVTESGFKPIRQLIVGLDKVLAKDEKTGIQSYKPIVAKYSNWYSEKVIIQSTNTTTGERLSVVSNKIHPIFTLSKENIYRVASEGHVYQGPQQNGVWVDASDLIVGDHLLNSDGTWSIVNSLEIVEEEFQAFNLSVQDFSTYFVGEQGKQSAYWVHNTCPSYLKLETMETVLKAQDKFGEDSIKLNIFSSNNSVRNGSVQVTDLSGRKIGEIHNGTLVPIYRNSGTLKDVTKALDIGTATRIGPVENGYQTVLFDGNHYIVRAADTSGISVNDLAQLTAHENSHTIARHGADITDAQLLVRAQTGITPDGIIASVPSMSTRFSSNQKLVQAKNDVQNQFDNGNFTLDGNDRIVKINSADVYGQGIAGGAPDGTLPTDVTGVTARYRENSDGVWQLVTMFPGTTT